MITLTINKKKIQVPTMDELTVAQFIQLSKFKEVNIVNYLSACLDKTYKQAFNLNVKGLDKFIKRLGKYEDYTKIHLRPLIIDDALINIKNIKISTVGQRHTIEMHAASLDNEELLCFVLAIGMAQDPMNIEEVNELKIKLMDLPYKRVLPNAFFLLNRFSLGKRSATNYLKMLRQLINMKMRELRQMLRGLPLTLTGMKRKLYAN